jgi:hypothetical protein
MARYSSGWSARREAGRWRRRSPTTSGGRLLYELQFALALLWANTAVEARARRGAAPPLELPAGRFRVNRFLSEGGAAYADQLNVLRGHRNDVARGGEAADVPGLPSAAASSSAR